MGFFSDFLETFKYLTVPHSDSKRAFTNRHLMSQTSDNFLRGLDSKFHMLHVIPPTLIPGQIKGARPIQDGRHGPNLSLFFKTL